MTSAQSPKRELSIEVKCSRDKPQVLKVPDITQASTKKRSREEQPNEVKKPWYVEEGETDEEVPTFFKNILLGKAASAKTKKPPAKRPRTKLAKKSLRDSQSSMPKKVGSIVSSSSVPEPMHISEHLCQIPRIS